MNPYARAKGLFGPLIVLILLGLIIYIWILLVPNITPILGDTIQHTQQYGGPNADGTEFFLRMIPWAIPLIIILGFLWLLVRGP